MNNLKFNELNKNELTSINGGGRRPGSGIVEAVGIGVTIYCAADIAHSFVKGAVKGFVKEIKRK